MKKPRLDADHVLQALGDPTRRAIVERLSERPHSVSGLAAPLDITLTAVGQHLQVLEKAGLSAPKRSGGCARVVSIRRDLQCWSNGSAIAVRPGNKSSIGWAICSTKLTTIEGVVC